MAPTDNRLLLRCATWISAAVCFVFLVSGAVRAASGEVDDDEARLWMTINESSAAFYGMTKDVVQGQTGAITTIWLDGGGGYFHGNFVAAGSEYSLSCGNRKLYGIHLALVGNDYAELKNPWSLTVGQDCLE